MSKDRPSRAFLDEGKRKEEVDQPVANANLETRRKEMGRQLESFLSSYNKIAVRSDFIIKVHELPSVPSIPL